ncbi:class I SAM-dependent methyltransferase [Paenibacillus sacheonensis]|uniref:Methyltransferase domain-containing protein n=1 Tax=Paenibacillus sacheonensis TaxID=742054 RepID=A0A7X4YW31_9BACL|nr:class I SAM-dependent methyltransferase [Paenibacillus sacheonensis]MBM7568818.1 SAM-dependent methyltransferase [Paenibacillus sacheonensis]NBC72524.1 methyltransferase domain-containing protein [Paenibacillus sacheonensis]
MNESVLDFYDELTEDYHLLFADWKRAVTWQGDVLSRIIEARLGGAREAAALSLLDCSCGIGTQAIGLAQHGFRVTGTDLSPVSIARARREAASFGVDIPFGMADFRTLAQDVAGEFDVVLSADNAVPHLLTDEDLALAARNMHAKVTAGGLLLLTMRDYDMLAQEKPGASQPRTFDNGKRIVFQVWDWADDAKTYRVNHFILQETDGHWSTKHSQTRYRALLRDELSHALRTVGFSEIEWLMPEESGYYQPVVTARKL